MRRAISWQVLAAGAVFMLLLLAAVVFLPAAEYPGLSAADLHGVSSVSTRVDLQNARYALQNDFRGQLIQVLAALIVVAGAIATWKQIQITREGQIAERFTRAIDHLGSDKPDIRRGGIYALERIALNSPADRASVTRVLMAFVHQRAPWPVGFPDRPVHPTPVVDTTLPWLSHRANDVQTAMQVLARRPGHPDEPRLLLARADLRGMFLSGPHPRLNGAAMQHSNLARASMHGAQLERNELMDADLRQAGLRGACLAHADLRSAHLQGADLRSAALHHADVRGANLTDARLDGADLTEIRTDDTTIWPAAYSPPPPAGKADIAVVTPAADSSRRTETPG